MAMYLRKRAESFKFAFAGLRLVWAHEANFRIQAALALVAIGTGWFLKITHEEWLSLLLVIGLVLVAEVFNTALEQLCDMLRSTHDPHVGKIKDLGAGAVLVASI